MEASRPNPDPALDVPAQLAAARTGSTQALGQLLEMSRAYLLSVANRELESQLQAKAGASDLVQDAFLEAQRIFARFQGASADELLAWLRAILLNKLADFTRAYRDTAKRAVGHEVALDADSDAQGWRGELPGDASTPSGVAVREEDAAALRAALERLPEHYRQVLVWREWDDLSFEEIAARLNRSVAATRMVWFRALKQLQENLGPPA